MWSWIFSWKFWLIVIVLVILFLWILTKIMNYFWPTPIVVTEPYQTITHRKRKKKKRKKQIETSDLEEQIEISDLEDPSCYSPIRPDVPVQYTISPDPEVPVDTRQTYYDPEEHWDSKPVLPVLPNHINQIIEHGEPEPYQMSKGEQACKEAIERIYGVPFHRIRPSWLRNPKTGRSLEIDAYNDQLKIGVEYHGEQHYHYVPRFQKSLAEFNSQVYRDQVKLDICDRVGVYLIVVPYTCPLHLIEKFIRYYLPEAVKARANLSEFHQERSASRNPLLQFV